MKCGVMPYQYSAQPASQKTTAFVGLCVEKVTYMYVTWHRRVQKKIKIMAVSQTECKRNRVAPVIKQVYGGRSKVDFCLY